MATTLVSDIILPEVDRQISQDQALWPPVKGFFILSVTKKRKPSTTWYILFQGNEIQPIITKNEAKVRDALNKKKVKVVKIRVEDHDVLNFITGGLTAIKAYVNRRIKVKGDLALAQRLVTLFEKAGGHERALDFIRQNEQLLLRVNPDSAKL
ncbi:uncharacterized protein BX664DRAFT_328588 [Halteromyces radiatus]|uniref:uncharacterized protein n=1 Tax=Halteromyces radiatus TaxID=101107 RepID=UPI0022204E20|nr:uncharacterized protein BX664DRAFT_328588 [Halteromyces radiatus]KAI8092957.1 hypothetical protein BX664DRAFT_328588 [Halteromyces radiatus]